MRTTTIAACILAAGLADAHPQEPQTDACGDPLPAGALARLGTTRLRQPGTLAGIGFTPDGKSLLSAGSDGNNRRIYRWDVESGRNTGWVPIRELNYMRACAFSADGKAAVSIHPGTGLHAWEVATGRKLFSRGGRWNDAPALAISSDGALVAGGDGPVIRIFDAAGKEAVKLQGHSDYVAALTFSPDARMVLSAGADFTVRLWDVAAGKERMKVDLKWPHAVALSPDGRSFAAAGDGSTIRRWDIATGRELFELEGHERSIHAITFSQDGKLIASASSDKTLRLWDAVTGKKIWKAADTIPMGPTLAFSPDGTLLACGLDLWDVATGRERHARTAGHTGRVGALAFSPDGATVASAGSDASIRLWDRGSSRTIASLSGHASLVHALAWSRSGTLLASAGADSTLRIWDPAAHREKTVVKLKGVSPLTVTFLNDGKTVAASCSDGRLRFWDATSGDERTPAPPDDGRGGAFATGSPVQAVSPDGTKVAVVHPKDHGSVLSIAPVPPVPGVAIPLEELTAFHVPLRWSPDGRLVAACTGMELSLYDVVLQKKVAGWKLDLGDLFAFSADSRLLAARDRAGTIRVVEVASRSVVREFAGHLGGVSGMAFAPNGRVLATGGEDTTVLLWDLSVAGAGDDPEKLWDGLGDSDGAKGYAAAWGLIALGDRAVPVLCDRLHRAPPSGDADPLIAELDAERPEARDNAFEALKKIEAESAVLRALEGNPKGELRARLEGLLSHWSRPITDDPARWREARAILVLERIGTAEASKGLEQLSQSATRRSVRIAAQAARARLAR